MITGFPLADILWIVLAIYFVAGIGKGIVGLGLPTVGVGLGTLFLGLDQALAIATVPVVLTNIWQAGQGGQFWAILRRTWVMMLLALVLTALASQMFTWVDPDLLTIFLGLVLMAYAVLGLSTPKFPAPGRHESWMAPLAGSLTGIVTGITGSSMVPGVMYLQSLNLGRDVFVQSLGILFTTTYIGLVIGLGAGGILTRDIALVSFIAVLPAIVGMVIGLHIRHSLNESVFRKTFLTVVLGLGLYLAGQALATA